MIVRVTENWNRLPREVAESLFLEISDIHLSNPQMTLPASAVHQLCLIGYPELSTWTSPVPPQENKTNQHTDHCFWWKTPFSQWNKLSSEKYQKLIFLNPKPETFLFSEYKEKSDSKRKKENNNGEVDTVPSNKTYFPAYLHICASTAICHSTHFNLPLHNFLPVTNERIPSENSFYRHPTHSTHAQRALLPTEHCMPAGCQTLQLSSSTAPSDQICFAGIAKAENPMMTIYPISAYPAVRDLEYIFEKAICSRLEKKVWDCFVMQIKNYLK